MKEFVSCIKNLPRHFRSAVANIWRNGAMTFSSIFAVTITLLLIGVLGVLALNVQGISINIEQGVRIYVKLERDISKKQEEKVGEEIGNIKGIKEYKYSSKDDELDKLIERQGEEGKKLFESYRKDNPLGAAYEVEVINKDNLASIAEKIEVIENVNSVNYGGESTQTMVKTLKVVQKGGSICIVALAIVALFMISNTIRMTIGARETEISIMRMVGASNWYIRIPFMLEGMLIGLLGAIIPIIVVVYGYNQIYAQTSGSLVSALLILQEPMPLLRNISFILAGLGAGVGFVGSFVSIRKFLKF